MNSRFAVPSKYITVDPSTILKENSAAIYLESLSTTEREAILLAWAAALRSKEFRQGNELLRDPIILQGERTYAFTAMGVLLQMLVEEPRYIGPIAWEEGAQSMIRMEERILCMLGLGKRCPGREWPWFIEMEKLNDKHRLTFRHIADVIENQLMEDLRAVRLLPRI